MNSLFWRRFTIPASVGNFVFAVQATDGFGGAGMQSFDITIEAAAPKIVSTLPTLISLMLTGLLAAFGALSWRRHMDKGG